MISGIALTSRLSASEGVTILTVGHEPKEETT